MEIKEGLSEKNIAQLIEYTKDDPLVDKFTSDKKRFLDKFSFEEWLKKGRKIYSLVDEKDNLLGITWFGHEGEGFTLAIRIYGPARGKGLAESLLRETMEKFKKTKDYVESPDKNWWLETAEDNLPARKIYEKLGFVNQGNWTVPGKVLYKLEENGLPR